MIISSGEYFELFSSCLVIKGAKNNIICDLQRSNYIEISFAQLELLNQFATNDIASICSLYDANTNRYIFQFIQYLAENDLGFITTEKECFPKMSMEWKSPFNITNAIVDVKVVSRSLLNKVIEIANMNCPFIQFRIFQNLCFKDLNILLEPTLDSRVQSIEIIMPFDESINKFDDEIRNLIDINLRITNVLVYNSPIANIIVHRGYIINYIEQQLDNIKYCGIVDKSLFSLNVSSFMESNNYNSCLNRKISIDSNGDIKNCPSMTEVFGNINDTTLAEAIEKPGFKKYWGVNKDLIHVCKDCEFRYICTDCRAYIEDPKDILSKPLKCGYNPYTGEWSEWSTNPLKARAIKYYGMEELVAERKERLKSDSDVEKEGY